MSDQWHCRQLTKSLLRRDFGIEVDLLGDRLCPPVRPFPPLCFMPMMFRVSFFFFLVPFPPGVMTSLDVKGLLSRCQTGMIPYVLSRKKTSVVNRG